MTVRFKNIFCGLFFVISCLASEQKMKNLPEMQQLPPGETFLNFPLDVRFMIAHKLIQQSCQEVNELKRSSDAQGLQAKKTEIIERCSLLFSPTEFIVKSGIDMGTAGALYRCLNYIYSHDELRDMAAARCTKHSLFTGFRAYMYSPLYVARPYVYQSLADYLNKAALLTYQFDDHYRAIVKKLVNLPHFFEFDIAQLAQINFADFGFSPARAALLKAYAEELTRLSPDEFNKEFGAAAYENLCACKNLLQLERANMATPDWLNYPAAVVDIIQQSGLEQGHIYCWKRISLGHFLSNAKIDQVRALLEKGFRIDLPFAYGESRFNFFDLLVQRQRFDILYAIFEQEMILEQKNGLVSFACPKTLTIIFNMLNGTSCSDTDKELLKRLLMVASKNKDFGRYVSTSTVKVATQPGAVEWPFFSYLLHSFAQDKIDETMLNFWIDNTVKQDNIIDFLKQALEKLYSDQLAKVCQYIQPQGFVIDGFAVLNNNLRINHSDFLAIADTFGKMFAWSSDVCVQKILENCSSSIKDIVDKKKNATFIKESLKNFKKEEWASLLINMARQNNTSLQWFIKEFNLYDIAKDIRDKDGNTLIMLAIQWYPTMSLTHVQALVYEDKMDLVAKNNAGQTSFELMLNMHSTAVQLVRELMPEEPIQWYSSLMNSALDSKKHDTLIQCILNKFSSREVELFLKDQLISAVEQKEYNKISFLIKLFYQSAIANDEAINIFLHNVHMYSLLDHGPINKLLGLFREKFSSIYVDAKFKDSLLTDQDEVKDVSIALGKRSIDAMRPDAKKVKILQLDDQGKLGKLKSCVEILKARLSAASAASTQPITGQKRTMDEEAAAAAGADSIVKRIQHS